MSDIYDQHEAAFAQVSAFVILDGAGERCATIAFKHPRDGAGRLWCYLHVFGVRMVRGYASGFGYDKKTAAASAAARHLLAAQKAQAADGGMRAEAAASLSAIHDALKHDGGYDWSRELENRGFRVLQAV